MCTQYTKTLKRQLTLKHFQAARPSPV